MTPKGKLVGRAAALVAAAFVVAPAFAQTREPLATQEPSEPRWQLYEKNQDLADFVDACASVLGVPIEYSRSEVSGPLSIRPTEPATADELWEVANRALAAKNLTSVQQPGSPSLTIVALDKAPTLARLEDSSLQRARAGFVKVLIELQHERTDTIGDAVKLVLSKAGAVTVIKDSRSLLVSDFRASAIQAVSLAHRLDGEYEDLGVIEIPVTKTSPTSLVALIERITTTRKTVFGDKFKGSLLAQPEGRSVLVVAPRIEEPVWRDLVERFDRADPISTRNYFPRRFGVRETAKLVEQVVPVGAAASGWKMIVDDLTGALVVSATPAQHHEIEELFTRLESASQGPRKPLRSFPVKNRPVEELKTLLDGMLAKGVLQAEPEVQKGKTGVVEDRPPQGVSGPLPSTSVASSPPIATDKLGDEIVLTADHATNRLIAMGNARTLEQLGLLIAELDQRTPQVLVEAMVVVLTKTETEHLGVELSKLGTAGDTRWRLTSLFALGNPDPAAAALPAPGGTGLSGVVLDPGSFSALVRALETVTKGRTQTMPKLLVDNHQTAELNSVLQTPFASTNASTTVATTSFGGTQDAGTQISVTPQIAEGDQVLLDYSISLSAFVGTAASPTLPPPRQENKLKSVASVPDGYTVIVGGLEIQSSSDSQTKTPLLGSLPLLGALFRDRTESEDTSRMYVFLRTSVMRSETFEDLRYQSEQDLARAKVEDDWPKLEPRVIR